MESLLDVAAEAVEAGREYLASEQGRELRRKLAAAVIVAAPLVSELPMFRRSPLGRLVRTAAVGTVLVKGAEWLRDWEPPQRSGSRPQRR